MIHKTPKVFFMELFDDEESYSKMTARFDNINDPLHDDEKKFLSDMRQRLVASGKSAPVSARAVDILNAVTEIYSKELYKYREKNKKKKRGMYDKSIVKNLLTEWMSNNWNKYIREYEKATGIAYKIEVKQK